MMDKQNKPYDWQAEADFKRETNIYERVVQQRAMFLPRESAKTMPLPQRR